jgi:Putative Flp pilus-assembly TadE/G-like
MARLARDTSGNVLAMIAASLFPLLALLGGGIDMGRGYLAQSRLQQACDAGTLAARKRLGSNIAVDGVVPDDVAETGQRFFNLNFQDGAYGTENRSFEMALEDNFSISGTASVDVPTTLMAVFGFDEVEVSVDCASILNFSDLDIMMVVDTTGSMRHTNPGDTMSRLESVKQVIRDFYAQIEGSKAPGTEIRYGFVPYATNVNVGHLLEDDWVVDNWTYQSRDQSNIPSVSVGTQYTRNWEYVSGTRTPWGTWLVQSTYPATWNPPVSGDQSGWYSCNGATPADTIVYSSIENGSDYNEIQTQPPAILSIQPMQLTENGRTYRSYANGSTCEVQYRESVNYVQDYEDVTEVPSLEYKWRYRPISRDVTNWRTEQEGCIEERDTYQITDYDNVDFTRALDLDIDRVPTAGDPSTQWRPRYPQQIYVRSMRHDGTGSFTTAQVVTNEEYVDSGTWWFSDCPAAAQRLTEMTSTGLDTYLGTLDPYGATYHDIGMIWGGRLLSPTGLFAADNADTDGHQRSRHMIWLTDGQTEPFDLAYGAYGVDPLDQRRWAPGGSATLSDTIESRFTVACEQVKNRNITVWVVAFGTELNPIMEECGGPGRTFEASNAEELSDAFQEIARSMSELRVSS